jgi:hypothetical protein
MASLEANANRWTMPQNDAAKLIERYAQRLEMSLNQHLGVSGNGLAQAVDAAIDQIPGEIGTLLQAASGDLTRSEREPVSDEDAMAFAFRAGQIVEKLGAFRAALAAEQLPSLDADGRNVADPERLDFDRISHWMVVRDRLLRKAADFSLKILVTVVLALVIGFSLGLI